MNASSALRKLGFDSGDRAVIIHADDIGMFQASVSAFADLVNAGTVSSGAVMVTCPWFSETAALLRENTSLDIGVHLTLTSEWTGCRWGPISTRDPASGILDEHGYFYRVPAKVIERASASVVYRELRAQLEAARREGIEVTHLDSHMFTCFHPKFLPVYLQLAIEEHLPPLVWRMALCEWGYSHELGVEMDRIIEDREPDGIVRLDNVIAIGIGKPEERVNEVKHAIRSLEPGISHFLIHPVKDSTEVRAACPDWRARVADYEAFTRPDLRNFVRDSGVHVIEYRQLRELMRASAAAPSTSVVAPA
jgi:chitin disaccharide deacetylase